MRMRWFVLVALALFAAAFWAYRMERSTPATHVAPVAPVAPATHVAPVVPAAPASTATAAGIVIDETGQPVAGAKVSVLVGYTWGPSTTTDGQGRWTLHGVPSGKVELDVAPGDSTGDSDDLEGGPAYEGSYDLDGPRGDLVIHVAHNAIVEGMVVDAAGKPLAHATVHFGTSMHGAGWLETDDQGAFRARSMNVGRMRVEAYTDLLGAPVQWLTLAPRGHATLRFVLAPSSIAGTAVDPRGKPIADGFVNANGPVDRRLWSIENGHFDLGGLSPGDYKLVAGHSQAQLLEESELPVVNAHTGNRHVVLVIPDP